MKVIHLTCLAAFLAGCSIFPTPEPKTQYTLSAPALAFENKAVFSEGIIIKAPTADTSLNTPEIAVSPEKGTRTYIQGALWTDRAPLMFQSLLIQGFENSNLFTNVGAPGSGVTANLILQSQLRDFSVHYENGLPVVHVDLFAKILNLETREVMTSQRFTSRISLDQNNLTAIRGGFQKAVDQMIGEIIQWMTDKS